VAVVVGGVVSTRGGWESQPQGEGPQVGSFNESGRTEVIDLVEPSGNDWTPARNVRVVRVYWRAGYGDDSSVRFGGRWAETYTSDGAARRPSTLWKPTRPHPSNQTATGELPVLPLRRRLAWAVSGAGGAQWP
jgi:hypothetical protein